MKLFILSCSYNVKRNLFLRQTAQDISAAIPSAKIRDMRAYHRVQVLQEMKMNLGRPTGSLRAKKVRQRISMSAIRDETSPFGVTEEEEGEGSPSPQKKKTAPEGSPLLRRIRSWDILEGLSYEDSPDSTTATATITRTPSQQEEEEEGSEDAKQPPEDAQDVTTGDATPTKTQKSKKHKKEKKSKEDGSSPKKTSKRVIAKKPMQATELPKLRSRSSLPEEPVKEGVPEGDDVAAVRMLDIMNMMNDALEGKQKDRKKSATIATASEDIQEDEEGSSKKRASTTKESLTHEHAKEEEQKEKKKGGNPLLEERHGGLLRQMGHMKSLFFGKKHRRSFGSIGKGVSTEGIVEAEEGGDKEKKPKQSKLHVKEKGTHPVTEVVHADQEGKEQDKEGEEGKDEEGTEQKKKKEQAGAERKKQHRASEERETDAQGEHEEKNAQKEETGKKKKEKHHHHHKTDAPASDAIDKTEKKKHKEKRKKDT